jgi:hypothetical protein
MILRSIALCAAGLAIGGSPELADDGIVRFTSPDGGPFEHFGRKVALDGNVLVVGEYEYHDPAPVGTGAAYVYRLNADESNWDFESQLLPSGGDDIAFFSDQLALENDVLVVFGMHWPSLEGYAYVYRFDPNASDWIEEQILIDPNDPPGLSFGENLDISGDVIFATGWGIPIWAFRYDPNASAWMLEQEIIPDANGCDNGVVSVDGDRAVIGYPYNDDLGFGAGTALVFEYDHDTSTWTQTARLNASGVVEEKFFGTSVALAGDFVAIGNRVSASADETGSVFIFAKVGDSWEEVARVTRDDGAAYDRFGRYTDFDGQTLVVGAPNLFYDNAYPGATYIYDFDPQTYDWSLRTMMKAPSSYAGDFGGSVALSAERLAIGDPDDEEIGEYAGAAYIVDVGESDCPEDVTGDDVVNVDDLFAIINAWGPCDDCAEDINADGVVNVDDLFAVINAWGPCE